MRAQTALLYCVHRYLILTCLLASLCSIPMGCLGVSTCIYFTMNKHSMTHKLVECGKVGEVAHETLFRFKVSGAKDQGEDENYAKRNRFPSPDRVLLNARVGRHL